jgi:hypothetical protein
VQYLCLVELWSVYHQAAEASCAVRKVIVEQDGLRCTGEQLFGSVWEARSVLARRGLVRVPRGAGDEPSLVETWL